MPIYCLNGTAPRLADDFCWIAETAVVIGDVSLDEDVGVWFGAVLRGDNASIAIGRRTNIQEHAVIHTDPGFPVTIGEGCTIGHRAIVHGCSIGDNSLVGMGADILNGAAIGRNCLIGAGALVREREQIPDNSLVVGAPAKVIRQIDEKGEGSLRASAIAYVEKARLFSRTLERCG